MDWWWCWWWWWWRGDEIVKSPPPGWEKERDHEGMVLRKDSWERRAGRTGSRKGPKDTWKPSSQNSQAILPHLRRSHYFITFFLTFTPTRAFRPPPHPKRTPIPQTLLYGEQWSKTTPLSKPPSFPLSIFPVTCIPSSHNPNCAAPSTPSVTKTWNRIGYTSYNQISDMREYMKMFSQK